MKQLQLFFDKLRKAGYSISANWQQDLNKGMMESVTITGSVGSTYVLFHIYEGDNGYQMYIESKGNTFDDDLNTIKGIVG